MTEQAFILALHFLSINLVIRYVLTFFMMIVELSQRHYFLLALLFVVRTNKFDL
jgi:hypothetical protein